MKRFLYVIGFISYGMIAQNNVCFEIQNYSNPNEPALSYFTKYVNVLDCFDIFAESGISDVKILHAAAVAAELLDNNEDGIVDDPQIKSKLIEHSAMMPLLMYEGSNAEDALVEHYEGDGISAVLYNFEIDPNQPGHWGDDASVEEILHTINHVGHTNVYPNAFGLSPNSSLLSEAMDVARGGQFINFPGSYPEEAWYHYDDYTCDYECMAIEYLYWAILSNMGILNDPQTCAGITNEWEPCTPALFENTDELMYALITNPIYMLPLNAPDGNYCPEGMNLNKIKNRGSLIYPNPAKQSFNYFSDKRETLWIQSIDGKTISSKQIFKGNNEINISQLNKGIYIIKVIDRMQKLIVK
tara:strand:- start:85 stop:1152 length:1068 start_codon:yes stop_codon:yes gene_type:complete